MRGKRVSRKRGRSVGGVKRDKKGGLRSGGRTENDKEGEERKRRRRRYKQKAEEKDHTERFNPRDLATVTLFLLLLLCYISRSLWRPYEALHVCLFSVN